MLFCRPKKKTKKEKKGKPASHYFMWCSVLLGARNAPFLFSSCFLPSSSSSSVFLCFCCVTVRSASLPLLLVQMFISFFSHCFPHCFPHCFSQCFSVRPPPLSRPSLRNSFHFTLEMASQKTGSLVAQKPSLKRQCPSLRLSHVTSLVLRFFFFF